MTLSFELTLSLLGVWTLMLFAATNAAAYGQWLAERSPPDERER
ncbi:hypothetical protein [Salinilacihabitans rarus]|nr:hypothetical protein [Salinilacihabitans rarus]